MDLFEAIQKLNAEKESLERAIQALELLQEGSVNGTSPLPRSRRGRKSMAPAERQEVSERMKRYWASRRVASGEDGRQ